MTRNTEKPERYRRHLSLPEIGRVGQETLRAARVLVLGVGELGSAAGKPRVLNPEVEVQSHAARLSPENADGLLEGGGFVLDATDNFEAKSLIAEA